MLDFQTHRAKAGWVVSRLSRGGSVCSSLYHVKFLAAWTQGHLSKRPGIKGSHPRGGRTRLVPWTKEARGQSQEVTSQRLGHQRCFSNDQSSEALDVSWVSDNFIQF